MIVHWYFFYQFSLNKGACSKSHRIGTKRYFMIKLGIGLETVHEGNLEKKTKKMQSKESSSYLHSLLDDKRWSKLTKTLLSLKCLYCFQRSVELQQLHWVYLHSKLLCKIFNHSVVCDCSKVRNSIVGGMYN